MTEMEIVEHKIKNVQITRIEFDPAYNDSITVTLQAENVLSWFKIVLSFDQAEQISNKLRETIADIRQKNYTRKWVDL